MSIDSLLGYSNAQAQLGGKIEIQSMTDNLKIKKAELEKKLSEVNAAIEALEANPGIEKVLNLISKVRY